MSGLSKSDKEVIRDEELAEARNDARLNREYDAVTRVLRDEAQKARLETEPYKTRWQKILEFFGISREK